MGRGRAKAKQTKVARELKYHTPSTDLDSLQRELGSPASIGHSAVAREDSDDDDLDDRWASTSG
jgi:Protein of unknown function (DUF3073)